MPNLKQHESIKYSGELTSHQIWVVLNDFIYEAAAPLCAYGNMSLEAALSCMAISTNRQRKIAADTAEDLLSNVFCELAQQIHSTESSRIDLLEWLLQKGIERNILIDHVTYALQTTVFPDFISREKLYRHVGVQLDDYDTFKRDVVFRYFYLIENSANRNYYAKHSRGLRSTKDDMFNVYIISTMRALDKFIPFEGALTSYIQNWFKNAEGSSDFMTYDNEAFSLNRAVRRSVQEGEKHYNNKAIPIQDRESYLAAEAVDTSHSDFAEFSRHLARLPNATIVFLSQALPYSLSHAQKQRITEHNQEYM